MKGGWRALNGDMRGYFLEQLLGAKMAVVMPRPPTLGLTDRQRQTLLWVKTFIARHGIPPTVREVGNALGVESSSAFYLLEALRTKGYLCRSDLGARSLRMAAHGRTAPNNRITFVRAHAESDEMAPVPLLGTVSAGHPILAEENRVGDVWIDKALALRGRCFALQIKGDSMTQAGIQNGDIVIARQQPVAQDREIVVALLGNEATVKELSIRGDRIELRPKNPAYTAVPIGPEDDFQVLGKVIAAAPGRGPHIKRRDCDDNL